MPRIMNVTLSVEDLAVAVHFYEAIGCRKVGRAKIDQAAEMQWSETTGFQLLTHRYFANYTPKTIVDAKRGTEMQITLTLDSREEVDAILEAVEGAGGKVDAKPLDTPWLYCRTFEDPDGHMFEVVFMDVEKAQEFVDKQVAGSA